MSNAYRNIVIAISTTSVLLGAVFFVVRLHKEDEFYKEFISHTEEFSYEKAKQKSAEESKKEPAGALEGDRIPIMVYHSVRPHYPHESKLQEEFDITPELFEQELRYLKENNYTVISFDVLAAHFETGVPLPPKPVMLTFDDGWENQYRYAFPLLEKYGESGTFFIFTNAIGHRHFLSWKQVLAMRDAGMSIGGHTMSHPYLLHIKDEKKLEKEIAGGKKILELRLGRPITAFAYPFGEYNDSIIATVKAAGYRIARSSDPGTAEPASRLFTLRSVEATDLFTDFKNAVSGM